MKGHVVYKKGPHLGVEVGGEVYIAIPKKKLKGKVFVGDYVEVEVVDDEHARILDLHDRKNLLPKPRVANVDVAVVVFSLRLPDIDNLHLDSILAVLEKYGVEALIVLNKVDLAPEGEFERWRYIYENAGYDVVGTSAITGEGLEDLRKRIEGKTVVLAGPSGAGKTSLIKAFMPGLNLKVGRIGRHGRGRHTTTDITLIKTPFGGYVCDTPGFAKVEISHFVDGRELPKLYREFRRFQCGFSDCTHIHEPGCGVLENVGEEPGKVHPERYRTYRLLMKKLTGL